MLANVVSQPKCVMYSEASSQIGATEDGTSRHNGASRTVFPVPCDDILVRHCLAVQVFHVKTSN